MVIVKIKKKKVMVNGIMDEWKNGNYFFKKKIK